MAAPYTLPLPPELYLSGGYVIRLTALNATTGAVVPSVNISNASFQVELTSGDAAALAAGPFSLVPGPNV